MQIQTVEDNDVLTRKAGEIVTRHIEKVTASGDRLTVFLSGGSTPVPLYNQLSEAELEWEMVDIAQVDERWVAPDSEGSNAKLIRETLLRNKAEDASFTSMKTTHETPQDAEDLVNAFYEPLMQPHSLAILGMGTDGHVASWFPESEGTEKAMDCKGPYHVSAVTAKKSEVTGDHLNRMTLTIQALKNCSTLLLLTKGDAKKEVLEKAIDGDPALPASQLIQCLGNRLTILHAEG